jgi:hypothetical protein
MGQVQQLGLLAQCGAEPVAGQVGRAQAHHDGAQLVGRLGGELPHGGQVRLGGAGVAGHQGGRRLGRQAQAEQLLGHRVVQLAGDPVAFLHDGQLPAALVQPRVDQRDRRVRRQDAQQLLVVGGEPTRCVFVGQEQLTEDGLTLHNGHPDEAGHDRVRRGPPTELGMGPDVGQPHRPRVAQHHPEQAVLAGERPDRGPLLVGDPLGHELGEAAVVARHAQRGVAGVEQPPGARHDRRQHVPGRPARRHGQHGRAQVAQLVAVGLHRSTVPIWKTGRIGRRS